MLAPTYESLPAATRDLIRRRDLLRANAVGARRMAEQFDRDADELTAQINQPGDSLCACGHTREGHDVSGLCMETNKRTGHLFCPCDEFHAARADR